MDKQLFTAPSRGHANHGWLISAHTFSFASYYDPSRMGFGVLRVINDDEIAPGMGFGTHPHDNMEIITIPLEGAVAHKDSMGHQSIIHTGDVQVMSAGSGVTHSEFNASKTEWLKLFQIWVMTKTPNIKPRYDQKSFDFSKPNQWITIVESLDTATDALGIHQDVRFSIATLSADSSLGYQKLRAQNGIFIMVISGEVEVEETLLKHRDGLGIFGKESLKFMAKRESRVLVMDIPE